ncbi:hypothetical protein [Flavimobilis marinus]|uniref:hypothetical protein n=1 Tax=Flavimobilis marinus TaxID=285351 RepID=UPI000B894A88|nr:hypothetical protein [Flavimobilis marinus]
MDSDTGADACPDQKIEDTAEIERFVTIGEVTAGDDEGADFYGKEWRHYVPVTMTNPLDVTCAIGVLLVADGSDGSQVTDGGTFVLAPGASTDVQLLDLENSFEFTADTQDAPATEEITVSAPYVRSAPVYDYYDADFTFGEITGEPGAELLPVTITKKAVKPGVPEAVGAIRFDDFDIQGIDADGTVVATFQAIKSVAIEVGETTTFELPATTAAARNTDFRAYHPASVLDDIVEYRAVRYQPKVMEE